MRAAAAVSGRRLAQQRPYVMTQLIRSPSFVAGSAIFLFWCIAAACWRCIVPYPPFDTGAGPTLAAPGRLHWLGTDDLGRDVLSRVLAGAADVLTIAPAATVITIGLGVLLGTVAAYRGGAVDTVLMRMVDVILVFPPIIIALVIISGLGASPMTMILIIGLFGSPAVSRTIRSATLQQCKRDYIVAALVRGETTSYIIGREILPNIAGPIVVEATVRFGYAIFAAASLSFLGVSLQLPAADWGLTITTQRVYLQVQPWSTLGPALALASLVVSVNLISEQLRKVLASP